MATIKVKFRASSVAGHRGSITYQVLHHRVARLITTDYKINPSAWNEQKSCVIPEGDSGLQLIAQRIQWDVGRLRRIIKDLEELCQEYTSDDIVNAFHGISQKCTLFTFMESAVCRQKQLGHEGTAHNYRSALSAFKRFRGDNDIVIANMDSAVMEDFEAYLKTTGKKPNSISCYMRILRAVYNQAVEQGMTTDNHPFRSVFTGTEKTLKRAISTAEMKCIRNLDLEGDKRLSLVRDVFLFQFYCRGMSFIDVAFLKKSNIDNGVISYHRHKTGQVIYVKVAKQIQELIDRWTIESSPFILPLIDNTAQDERKQYEAALRRMNNGLKEIAKRANVLTKLTTYTTRHTWATIAKQKNVPLPVISDALGHDSQATTQVYLASIDTSVIDNANDLILSDI